MKRFIYLDTDELNSYIAQIYNGLLVEKEEVKEMISTKKNEQNEDLRGDVTLSAKLINILNLSGEASFSLANKDGKEESELIKDIHKKIIHDESFDEFLKYLNINGMLKNENYEIGDFVNLNSEFKIFDLNYFLKLFDKDGFVDFLLENSKQENEKIIENKISQLNREERRNDGEIKKLRSEINSSLDKQKKEYTQIKNIIDAIKSVIPYEKIILADQFFIATDDKYFRDNPEMLGFKYGGKISCLGYITNVVRTETNDSQEGLDVLTNFKEQVNSIIFNLISNKEIFIIHPIAIYYE